MLNLGSASAHFEFACAMHLGRSIAGHELGAAALGEIAANSVSQYVLELFDLFRRPIGRHADQRVGDRAFGVIVELPQLAAQRDVGLISTYCTGEKPYTLWARTLRGR